LKVKDKRLMEVFKMVIKINNRKERKRIRRTRIGIQKKKEN